jgi:uncharacterized protein YyaL (SSP411 family)
MLTHQQKTWLSAIGAVLLILGAALGFYLSSFARSKRIAHAANTSANPSLPAQHSSGSNRYTNRLIREKSPYLLMHAHNPVDWYPWGDEAFEKARREQKPIFLSIGYYTCHWCHVMERESYSDPDIAQVLNQYFVSIKVDREERPDVDRLYITYVEATQGSAGWPLNVLLTPDLKPFYGGTYYPPDALRKLLLAVAQAWEKDRTNITQTANRAAQQLVQLVSSQAPANGNLQPTILDRTYQQIAATYDPAHGGFGGAPKFPRPVVLCFLLRYYARTGDRHALEMTLDTLRAMARGGIHDQLGGGFHRYSTDASWRVPHFEKMLYDQAQLAIAYTEAYQITHDRFFFGVTRDILDFTLREMRQPRGGFASAEDADSPLAAGKKQTGEGAFYVWNEREIESALGRENAVLFDYAYGVGASGNVPPQQDIRGELSGKNVLYEPHTIAETAKHFGLSASEANARLAVARKRLFEVRSQRPRPPLDDKTVTAWNGLMISALARASQALEEPRYLAAAQAAAVFVETHLEDKSSGRLRRSYRDGEATVEGVLDDYTDLIGGLLDLYQADFNVHWLTWAVSLQEEQDQLFWDAQRGGYFDASQSDSHLLARTREAYDGAEPSPNSTAAMNLLRLAQITNRADWRMKAEETLQAFGHILETNPEVVPALASAVDFRIAQTKQIVITGAPGASDTRVLLHLVNERFLPNKILLLADGGKGQEQLARWLPFLAGVRPRQGRATAYICENYVCKLPTADPKVAARLLDGKS